MADKRQKAAKVKCIRYESLTNSQYLWNIVFSRRSIWVWLELIRRWTKHFSKVDQEKCKIEQICTWNPMTNGFIMKTLIYVITMEFLSLSRRVPPRETSLSGDERGETSAVRTITKNRFCHLRPPAWLRQTLHSTPRLSMGNIRFRHENCL